MPDRSRRREPPGARLARSYLVVRAGQVSEAQPRLGADAVRASVRLPRLDAVHLNSPEAHAQHRLAFLARLGAKGEEWFVLADRTRPAVS